MSELTKEIIKRLYDLGHFRNPKYPTGVQESDLDKLEAEDDVVQQAVMSYQEFVSEELEECCLALHGRRAITDGQYGPATDHLLHQPRCGFPDHLEANAMEANWPDSCRLQITVSYTLDNLSLDKDTVRKSWELALKSWEDRITLDFQLVPWTAKGATRIWATGGPLGGSVLAWSMLAQNNCGSRLEQRYNTRTNWNLTFLQSTIAHEVGHALGSGHLNTRAALMYPSITDKIVPQEPDILNMLRLGYKRQTGPTPPPDPDPIDIPDGVLGGLMELLRECVEANERKTVRDYIRTPALGHRFIIAYRVRDLVSEAYWKEHGKELVDYLLTSLYRSTDLELESLLDEATEKHVTPVW